MHRLGEVEAEHLQPHLPGAVDFISGADGAVRGVCAWLAVSRGVCVSSACLSRPLERLLSLGLESVESALANPKPFAD